jgi:hypothetical protein
LSHSTSPVECWVFLKWGLRHKGEVQSDSFIRRGKQEKEQNMEGTGEKQSVMILGLFIQLLK